LVNGSSVDDHLTNLDKVLDTLATSGLKLNKAKCAFMLPRVEYLGHLIDESGLHPTQEKVRGIQGTPQPQNVTELRSFLGIINYYSKFLPNLSVTLSPLYHLLKKGVKWQWNQQHVTAFNKAEKKTPAEKNYTQLEKEALGVLFAVQKFHKYLYGRHFIIESDHRPLSFIFSNSKATASSRIIR